MKGIFLDTETNGLNPYKHRLVEIAYKIFDLKTGVHKDSFQAILCQTEEVWSLSDPKSLAINGFTYDEVSLGSPASQVANAVQESFSKAGVKRGHAVFICQNPSFDRAFFSQLIDPSVQEGLQWPYHWLDLASMYWAESVRKGLFNPRYFPWETGFSKDKIAAVYQLPPESKPHRAMQGVDHLVSCYKAVVGFPLT